MILYFIEKKKYRILNSQEIFSYCAIILKYKVKYVNFDLVSIIKKLTN